MLQSPSAPGAPTEVTRSVPARDDPFPPFAPIELGSGDDALRATVLPYGARLATLWVPSRQGPLDVVLGYVDPRRYATDAAYHGAPIGRVSGRIAGAGFELEGRRYTLEANEPPHHLHGGPRGFHNRAWRVLQLERAPTPRLVLALELADGTDGYPGRLEASITYTLEPDALRVELQARVDRTTPVALTMHPYFNLGGSHATPVLDHLLTVESDEILELDSQLIPTGARLQVAGTPFDFRDAARLDARLAHPHRQLELGRGLDHCFVLRPERARDARLRHADTRLALTLNSNQPALQVYAGHYLAPPPGAAPWRAHCGICLEPQAFPNAVNEPHFPSTLWHPGGTWRSLIRYKFSQRD